MIAMSAPSCRWPFWRWPMPPFRLSAAASRPLFLPCRVTVLEREDGVVQVMAINPKRLSKLFNNRELDQACDQMHGMYQEIIEEATL